MSEENQASAPAQPVAVVKTAASVSTNVVLLVGILAICGSILYVGATIKEEASVEPTPRQMELGDDFWMNLPEEVKVQRDKLAAETVILNEKLESVADKLAAVETVEDEAAIDKLGEEIDAVVGEQREKVRLMQRDFVRRINGLRTTYIQRKMNP